MEIVKMTAAHVDAVAALEKLCFDDPWSVLSILSELHNPLSLWLIAVENGDVLGYVGSQSVLGEADMMNLAVHPAHRRKGIGQMLITKLVEALTKQDVHCLTLEVRASNNPAIALYTRMGFVQVGLRRNYYCNPREDARILRKEWSL